MVQEECIHNLYHLQVKQLINPVSLSLSLSLSSPSLGESWGHMPTIRVILYWSEDERGEGEGGGRNRMALLFKSPSQPETCVPYQITVRIVLLSLTLTLFSYIYLFVCFYCFIQRDGVRDVVIIEKEYSSSDKISNKIRQETEKEVVTAEATAPLHNSTSIQDKMSPLSHSSLPFKRKCPVEMQYCYNVCRCECIFN